LPGARFQRDISDGANQSRVEFEADDEEQQPDAQFREQVDLVSRVDPVETGRSEQDARDDKRDYQGLSQPVCDGAEQGGDAQDNSNFEEWVGKSHAVTAPPQRTPESGARGGRVCKYLPR
jgi:hypothetical protein